MFSSLFTKQKSVTFQVTTTIHDITNVPYVSGLYFIKWKLRNGGSAAGLTHRVPINQYHIVFETTFQVTATIPIGKDGVLSPCHLYLVVKQQLDEDTVAEKIGICLINLAECAGSRTSDRKFLLEDSKINATIKISIDMKQIKGDPVFKVPPRSSGAIDLTNDEHVPIPLMSVTSPIEGQGPLLPVPNHHHHHHNQQQPLSAALPFSATQTPISALSSPFVLPSSSARGVNTSATGTSSNSRTKDPTDLAPFSKSSRKNYHHSRSKSLTPALLTPNTSVPNSTTFKALLPTPEQHGLISSYSNSSTSTSTAASSSSPQRGKLSRRSTNPALTLTTTFSKNADKTTKSNAVPLHEETGFKTPSTSMVFDAIIEESAPLSAPPSAVPEININKDGDYISSNRLSASTSLRRRRTGPGHSRNQSVENTLQLLDEIDELAGNSDLGLPEEISISQPIAQTTSTPHPNYTQHLPPPSSTFPTPRRKISTSSTSSSSSVFSTVSSSSSISSLESMQSESSSSSASMVSTSSSPKPKPGGHHRRNRFVAYSPSVSNTPPHQQSRQQQQQQSSQQTSVPQQTPDQIIEGIFTKTVEMLGRKKGVSSGGGAGVNKQGRVIIPMEFVNVEQLMGFKL